MSAADKVNLGSFYSRSPDERLQAVIAAIKTLPARLRLEALDSFCDECGFQREERAVIGTREVHLFCPQGHDDE